MGWIGCVRCEKFRHALVAQTFALIALFQLVLHQVSSSNEMIQNAPKHYETHENMSLGFYQMKQVHQLRIILTRFRGTNICSNCTSSAHFAQSFSSNEIIPNASKHCKTHQKGGLWSNGWIGCVRCENFQHEFMARTFELIAPVRPILHRVSCSNKMIPNAPKHYKMQ